MQAVVDIERPLNANIYVDNITYNITNYTIERGKYVRVKLFVFTHR